MAGMWFNGVMGSFSAYSVIGNGNGNRQEVPPHLDGGASQRASYDVQNRVTNNVEKLDANTNQHTWTMGGSQSGSTTTDAMKLAEQPRKGDNKS